MSFATLAAYCFVPVRYAFAHCARGGRLRTTSNGTNGTTSLREGYAESAGSTVVAVEDRSDRTGGVSDPGYAAVSDDQCGGSRGSVAQVDDYDLLRELCRVEGGRGGQPAGRDGRHGEECDGDDGSGPEAYSGEG